MNEVNIVCRQQTNGIWIKTSKSGQCFHEVSIIVASLVVAAFVCFLLKYSAHSTVVIKVSHGYDQSDAWYTQSEV